MTAITDSRMPARAPQGMPAETTAALPDIVGDGQANLDAFVRTRGSKRDEDVVFYWKGGVYSDIEGERSRRLFDFEGFNVARTVPAEGGGWLLLSREMAVYRDPRTHEILSSWMNPWTNQRVTVIPVLNDPVNQRLQVGPDNAPLMNVDVLGEHAQWNLDIFMRYPSPLPRSEYPRYSGSDFYQGAELFAFTTDTADLADPAKDSVDASLSWTRLGPWLPWMEMGDHPGRLVYQCHGVKLADGVAGLPQDLTAHAASIDAKFLSAPRAFSQPNETSWTYFRKRLENGAPPSGEGA